MAGFVTAQYAGNWNFLPVLQYGYVLLISNLLTLTNLLITNLPSNYC